MTQPPLAPSPVPAPERRPWRTVSRLLWLLVVVVVLATTLVVVLARTGEDRPRARVGEVFGDIYVDPDAFSERPATDVALPLGHYQLWVDAPRDDIRTFDDRDPTFAPPEGGSFVPIYVERDMERLIRYVTTTQHPLPVPVVELRVGDESYPVRPAAEQVVSAATSLQAYAVAIDGTADEIDRDDLSLAITWDGLTQVVDLGPDADEAPEGDVVDAGSAAALYDAPTVGTSSFETPVVGAVGCGRARWRDGFAPEAAYARPHCQVATQLRVPYVGGIGWADDGEQFLAVFVTRDEPGFARDRDGRRYQARDADVTYALDGAPALSIVKVNDLAGPFSIQDVTDPVQVVFAVPVDSPDHVLAVHDRYVGVTAEPGVELAPVIRIDWRMELPPSDRPTEEQDS